PGASLRFLLTAPWFALLAALLLLWAGEQALVSRWSAATLGATHLLTLGYLSMAMAGAMLQLIPVVTGNALAPARSSAAAAWYGLVAGALLLAAALALNATPLFLPAALLLASAFTCFVVPVARVLERPAPAAAMPMVRGMRTALAGLLVTVALGVVMTVHLGGHASLPVMMLADLHAAWGLVGWVAMLVVCVAFQVIPMFQSSKTYPALLTRFAAWLLAGLLLAWSAVWIGAPGYAHPAGMPAAAALAAFAALSAWLLTRKKRKDTDATTLYWRLSLASLAASAVLYLMPAGEAMALATGIVFVGGFAMGAVNGMLYKIVPFLLWYHMQQDPHASKASVLPIRTILPDARGRRQFRWHAAALAIMLAALAWPAWLARPAAAVLAAACLHLALDLGAAARRCRRAQAQFQPS
ncbi:MAG: permease, partial [Telluria sp.]